MAEINVPDSSENVATVMTCTVHPTVETSLRCNKCGRPMCMKCAVRTPVGYRCRECVRGQQQIFYNAEAADPFIQGAIAFVLGGLAISLSGLIPSFGIFGWLIAFWAGSAAGGLIGDLAHRAVNRRRGRYSWLIVGGMVALPGALALLVAFLIFGTFPLMMAIFGVMAVVGAAGRLRMGR
ncbi:MAG: hypothetical protein IT326_08190 [Anaerolineae bacterium]|nr:hypothetical protein [Anaerolineae bacterium]